MRIRTIKPEFWTDKRVASWDVFTRLFYIGLWSAADDYGRGSAEPERLAAELFPFDLSRDSRETLASVSRGLATLSAESRIVVYEVSGEVFFEIKNWKEHQRVDRPGKSRIPTPCDGFATPSRDTRETLATPSRLDQGSGIRDQGAGEQGERMGRAAWPRELIQQVEEVWAIWPKKLDPRPAMEAIAGAIQRDGFDVVKRGTEAICRANAERKTTPIHRYMPHPVKFFSDDAYLGDPACYGPHPPILSKAALLSEIKLLDEAYAKHPANPPAAGYIRENVTQAMRDELEALRQKLAKAKAALSTLG